MRKFFLSLAVGAVPQLAGEQVMLRNGFSFAIERHEAAQDGIVKLHTSTGVIEFPQEQIVSFEADVSIPAPPEASPVTPVSIPPASVSTDPKKLLDAAADRYGLPAALLHSVARTESAYQVNAVSPKGAIGVMQLMPQTAAELGANPHNPQENIDAGARHLRDLLDRYDGSAHKALSAYNAGAGAVEKYKGVPPYAETVNYVHKVLNTYHSLSAKTK
jgi:soluble lytic murein transglycosylase-like protein